MHDRQRPEPHEPAARMPLWMKLTAFAAALVLVVVLASSIDWHDSPTQRPITITGDVELPTTTTVASPTTR